MKKYFVIYQYSQPYGEPSQKTVAVRHCTSLEIEEEIERLNKACKNNEEDYCSFSFEETPIVGFSSNFEGRFTDRDLQRQAYRNEIKRDVVFATRAYSQQSPHLRLKFKDFFLSYGRVMDMYFNTSLTKADVEAIFDEFMESQGNPHLSDNFESWYKSP